MADDIRKSGIELVVEGAAKFLSDINGANSAMSDMASQGVSAASEGLDVLGEIATGALRKIGELVVDGVMELGKSLLDFVGDAMEGEKLLARLTSVIQATGGAAGVTVEEAQALATQFKDLAGGSDEAVLAIEEMALRMGTVSAEQMPGFIQTTLDLAAATGTDATNAARLLAQAYEDPSSALGRFRKMGIMFTADQEAQIKALVKAGDTAGAYAIMVARLGEATAGAAAGQAETLAGQIGIMQEHLLDAGKAIGESLLPLLKELFKDVIEPAIPIVEGLASSIADTLGVAIDDIVSMIKAGESPLDIFFTAIGDMLPEGLVDDWVAFGTSFKTVEDSFANWLTLAMGVQLFFTDIFLPALQTLWAETGIQFPTMQQVVDGAMQGIKDASQIAVDFFFSTFLPAAITAVDWVVLNWPKIQETFTAVLTFISALVTDVFVYVQQVIAAVMPAITANISGALTQMGIFWQNHGDQVITILAGIMGAVDLTLKAIANIIGATLVVITAIVEAFFALVNGDFALAQTVMTSSLDLFFSMIISMTGTNLETVRAAWQMVFESIVTLVQIKWNELYTFIVTGLAMWGVAWWELTVIAASVWKNILDGVAKFVTDATSGIQQFIIDTVNAFIGFVADVQAVFNLDWGAIGKGIIDGIVSGITNAAGNMATAAANAASGALQSAKDALGIQSPSAVAAAEIGAPFVQGIAQGILGSIGTLASVSQSATAAMISPPSNSVSNYSSVTNNTYNLSASYPMQSPGSLAQDVRVLQMLAA